MTTLTMKTVSNRPILPRYPVRHRIALIAFAVITLVLVGNVASGGIKDHNDWTRYRAGLFMNQINADLTKGEFLTNCANCDPTEFKEVTVRGITVVQYSPKTPGKCTLILNTSDYIAAGKPDYPASRTSSNPGDRSGYCGPYVFGKSRNATK